MARIVHATRAHRLLAVLATAIALSACTSIDPPNNDLLTSSIAPGTPRRSLCVVSALGDTFSVQRVGVTVFGNALDKLPIDAWGVDAAVASRISSQLGQRFDMRRIDYPKGAFASLETERSPLSSGYKDYREEIRDITRSVVASHKCDLSVVVTKGKSMFSNSNQVLAGLGIVDGSNPLIESVHLFALAEVRVFDGKTFQVLALKHTSSRESSFMAVVRGPSRKVDKSWWPAAGQVAQSAKLKQATLTLVEESLPAAIAELFAGP